MHVRKSLSLSLYSFKKTVIIFYYYYKSTELKWHYHIKDVAGTLYKIKINVCEAQIVQLTVNGKHAAASGQS